MTPQLKAYAEADNGYKQFCEQYNMVASDRKTQDEYFYWWRDRFTKSGIWVTGYEAGNEEWIIKRREEERERAAKEMFEKDRKAIIKMTASGLDDAAIADILNLPIPDISKYR